MTQHQFSLFDIPTKAQPIDDIGRQVGEITQNAINLMIHEMTGEGKAFALKVSLETGIKQMKAEHGYKDASPLEKLLIEQVMVCWLRPALSVFRLSEIDLSKIKGLLSIS